MGTETRIGIATGLLIVVVASVYFFYGSDRSAEDLLIATGGPAAEPPKIPAGRNDRLALSGRQRSEPAPRQALVEEPRTSARAVFRDSEGPRANRRRSAPALPGNQPRPKRQGVALRRDRSTIGQRFIGATKPQVGTGDLARGSTRQRSKKPSTIGQRRLPLRTGPSQTLVDATRNNVRPPSPTAGSIGRTERKDASRRPAAAPAKPIVSWPTRHRISAGDTLSDVSLRYYSTSAQVKHILRANPNIKNPNALKIGDILIIPAPAPQANAANTKRGVPSRPPAGEQRTGDSGRYPSSAVPTARRYRVQSGDTLYRIARKTLGNPSRWKEIYNQNRAVIGKDPLRLKPGMLLTLPN